MTLIDELFAPDSPIKRVFICGKITGDPDYRKKFSAAQKALEKAGYAVLNPAILPSEGFEHDQYMVITKTMMTVCDAVMFLGDWVKSPGAIEELEEATRKGIKAYSFETWQKEYDRRTSHEQCTDVDYQDTVQTVTDGLMQIIIECQDKVGKGFEPTRGNYEVSVIEAYTLMCDAYNSGNGVSPESIVTFGYIFDTVHALLDKKYGKEELPV